MGSENIPQWALVRALSLAESCWTLEEAKNWLESNHYGEALAAFARYIAEHEEPPVDPLLIIAREIVADEDASRTLNQTQAILEGHAGQSKVNIALTALRRGMELADPSK